MTNLVWNFECLFCFFSADIKIRSERSPIHSKIVLFREGFSLILGDFFFKFRCLAAKNVPNSTLFYPIFDTCVHTERILIKKMKRIWVKTPTVTHSYSTQPDKWI